ncbi:MAG: hypothetical protein IJP17_01220, partial [Clostridia bacterium]|nr:hypothetical protein [Clostridia bacterium]
MKNLSQRKTKRFVFAAAGIVFTLALVLGVVGISAFAEEIIRYDADATTAAAPSSIQNQDIGQIWADKSVYNEDFSVDSIAFDVNNANEDQFDVVLSALSNAEAETTPVDIVFVLDFSNSLKNDVETGKSLAYHSLYSEDPFQSKLEVMVESLNIAIDTIMNANPENRVGVVAFSALQDQVPEVSKVLMPLDHYVYVGEGDAEYLTWTAKVNDVTITDFDGNSLSVQDFDYGNAYTSADYENSGMWVHVNADNLAAT